MPLPVRIAAVALALGLVLLNSFAASACPARRGPRHPGGQPRMTMFAGRVRVHDGDTFSIGDRTIRLRGIDAPELGQPRADAAKRRLAELLTAGPLRIVRRAEDVYGRTVADVYAGGRNVAAILRSEGFDQRAGGARAGLR